MSGSSHVGTVELGQLAEEIPTVQALAASDADHAVSWAATFRARPEVMHAILADYVKHKYAVPGTVGQRPMPREADVDVEDLLRGPEVNMRPLAEVLPGLMPVSKTRFAKDTYMPVTRLNAILDGRPVTLQEVRLIAAAVHRNPAYFVEYRQLLVMEALDQLFTRQPNMATHLYRKFVAAHPEVR